MVSTQMLWERWVELSQWQQRMEQRQRPIFLSYSTQVIHSQAQSQGTTIPPPVHLHIAYREDADNKATSRKKSSHRNALLPD